MLSKHFTLPSILACTLTSTYSCQKNNSTQDTDSKTQQTTQPGSLAIEEGNVSLSIAALSSSSAFTEANATANASRGQPGTLAIGDGAELQSSNVTNSYLTTTWPAFEPGSITSGPPDGIKITINKIMLSGKRNNEVVNTTILDHSDGIAVSVTEGVTDLSALIAKAGASTDGSPEFKVATGEYDRVTVTFQRAASVKGCVAGDFNTMGHGVAGSDGLHTYCTKAALSSFDAVTPGPTEFEGGSSEWMAFDLITENFGKIKATDTFTIDYDIPGTLTVTKDAALDLTLLLDLNRMLRFYNQGRIDQGPNPSMPVNRSYFFNSIFSQSSYVFLGKPGRIYGYEFRGEACTFNSWNATNSTCTMPQGEQAKVVAAWLTIITDPTGKPILHSIMPDDDNTLTILKGSDREVAASYTAGTSDSVVNLHYSLGKPELGKIRGFPVNLESTGVDQEITGLTFEAHMDTNKCGSGTECDYQGPIYLRRKL